MVLILEKQGFFCFLGGVGGEEWYLVLEHIIWIGAHRHLCGDIQESGGYMGLELRIDNQGWICKFGSHLLKDCN